MMKTGKWAMDGEEKVMEELSKGRELAMQLRRVLLNIDHDHEPIIGCSGQEYDVSDDHDGNLVEHLAGKILDSFWNSLSILNNYSDHRHRITNSHSGSILPDHDQRISTTTVPKAAAAGRRAGCCKRRKQCPDSDIRKTEHSTLEYDDGHAWRKYGQKIIHNTKFPRSYYRCTHKYEQGCGATKQMEMIQQNPAKYASTYYGHHTCTSPRKHVQFLLESAEYYYSNSNSTNGSSNNNNNNNVKMLSFGADHHDPSCSPSTSTTFQLPAHSCTPMVFSSNPTLQAEEDDDHLMKINKPHWNTSSSRSTVKDDDDDGEQAGSVLLTQQLHAASDNWCLSPEYPLPIGSSDDDGASNDSLDFTDLQHYFAFS